MPNPLLLPPRIFRPSYGPEQQLIDTRQERTPITCMWLAKPIKNGDTFLPRDQGEMHSIKIDIHVSLLKVAFPFSSSLQLC